MRKEKLLAGLLLGCLAMPIQGKIEHLLPLPKTLTAHTAEAPFALNRSIRVAGTLGAQKVTNFIQQQGGTVSTDAAAPVIEIEKVATIAGARILEEAYTLTVASNLIKIEATAELGVIRALQTLTQLAEGYNGDAQVEALTLTDYPAFAVRGFMHDVGRGFVSMEELKKEINLLARFKVNVFHWHLTDHQGWRIESKLYPVLTQKSFSRLEGKFYTQAEATELVDYCMERGVKVIPEIDMPGHSASFEKALGYSMQSTEGVNTLVAILKEMCTTVFDKCETFHIGTDEVNISNPTFVSTMVSTVRGCGKKAMSWSPGASYGTNEIDMVQLWGSRGKLIPGIPNIDCRYMYSNHYDTYADVVGMYKTNIYYSQTGTNDIAGSIMGMWNDRAVATEKDVVTQNGLYASILALAERTWKGGGKQYIETGGVMLPASDTDEFKEFADWERRFLFHKENSMKDAPIPYVKQTNVRWRITEPFPNKGNLSATFPPETEGLKDSYTYEGNTYGTQRVAGAGIYLDHTWGSLIPALFDASVSNSTAYAYTYVYSPTAQTVGAQIEFMNYSRSRSETPPAQGNWDHRSSNVWVNGVRIAPPTWQNQGGVGMETPLKNENMSSRLPEQVTLQAGWNKVLLKLPIASDVKWMFTFVFTNVAGTKEASDLIYSPEQCSNADDGATDALLNVMSNATKVRNSKVGTVAGLYPIAAASDLDQVLATVSATLNMSVPAETRRTQSTAVQDALAHFLETYQSFPINRPAELTQTVISTIGAALTDFSTLTNGQTVLLKNKNKNSYLYENDKSQVYMGETTPAVRQESAMPFVWTVGVTGSGADVAHTFQGKSGKYMPHSTGAATLGATTETFRIKSVSTGSPFFIYWTDTNNKNYYFDGHNAGSDFVFYAADPNGYTNSKYEIYPVTVESKTVVYITYSYKWQGKEFARKEVVTPKGAAYAAPTSPFLTFTQPSGTATTTATVVVECTNVTLPFETTTVKKGVFSPSTKWYTMQLRKSAANYLYYAGTSTDKIEYANIQTTTPIPAKNLFAFTGNPIDGFKIYNKAAGVMKNLNATTASTGAKMIADAGNTGAWILSTNRASGGPVGTGYDWKIIQGNTTYYLNGSNSGSGLVYWDNNEANIAANKIVFTLDASQYDVFVGSMGYATFSADASTTIPSGVTAYTAQKDVAVLKLTPLAPNTILPAQTGVILRGTPNTTYSFVKSTSTGSSISQNDLSATSAKPVVVPTSPNYYVLNDGGAGVNRIGFYKARTTTTIPAYKAYYQGTGPGSLLFEDADLTGIDGVPSSDKRNDGKYYNLGGVEVPNPIKGGLYLYNGHAIVK